MHIDRRDSPLPVDSFEELSLEETSSCSSQSISLERYHLKTHAATMSLLPNSCVAAACTDGKVWFFERDLRLKQVLRIVTPTSSFWPSAIVAHPDGCVLGTTEGALSFYDSTLHFQQKNYVSSQQNKIPRPRPGNKSGTVKNIANIKHLAVQGPYIFVALPLHLQCWDRSKKIQLAQASVSCSHERHLYSIEPLLNGRLALAIGTALEIWQAREPTLGDLQFDKIQDVYQERIDHNERIVEQPPYISSTALIGTNKVAMALFSGLVKVTNVDRGLTYAYPQEHSGFVWSVCRVSDDVIATGDDKGTIKLWDVREAVSKPSACTIKSGSSKVTALAAQSPFELFSSTDCLNRTSIISQWDIRQLSRV